MNWYEIALGVVLIAVSLLIIVFTLAQEQKGQGLSAAIMGDNTAMAAGRERGVDAKLTKICGIIFFVVTLVACVLSARL
jgi:protein translocase SecG subunit